MNIAIVGFGKFGRQLTKRLVSDNHNIVIIEKHEDVLEEAINQFDVKGIVGNGASINTLKEAEIQNFDLLIALTSEDEVNILSCLVSKKLGVKNTIARVRNYEYSNQSDFLMNDLGVSLVLNSDYITSKAIFDILRYPDSNKVDSFANGKVELVEMEVSEDSIFNGMMLKDIKEKLNLQLLVCAVKRNEEIIIPNGDFEILLNDIIYLSSSRKELSKAFRKLKLSKTKFSSCILIGASRISLYLAKMLIDEGFSVKVIDKDKETCERFNKLIPEAIILNGDGANNDLLEEEGLKQSALVTLTGMDETNILISSSAKANGCLKSITKLSSLSYDNLLDTLGLDSIVSNQEAFSFRCLKFIRQLENKRSSVCENLYLLLDGRIEAIEFKVSDDAKYTNKLIKDLKIKDNNLIAAIIRNKEVIIPTGNDTILKDDNVVLISKSSNVLDLSEVIS